MCERVEGKIGARETPNGYLPNPGDIDLTGLTLPSDNLNELLKVDPELWRSEVPDIEKYFAQFGDRIPGPTREQLRELANRLG
jgi:phosphoenolpyruvate carboxykinase (GTP)